jgi:hypothetical protein
MSRFVVRVPGENKGCKAWDFSVRRTTDGPSYCLLHLVVVIMWVAYGSTLPCCTESLVIGSKHLISSMGDVVMVHLSVIV